MKKRVGRPKKQLARTTIAIPQKTVDDIEMLKAALHTSRNEIVRQAIDVLRFVVSAMEVGDYLAIVNEERGRETRIVLPGLVR